MAGPSSDDRLQLYFDGELSDAHAAKLRAELEADEALRAKLEGLARLRTLLVASAEERGDEVDSEALWNAIAARLGEEAADDDPMLPRDEAEPEPVRPQLAVLPGGRQSEPVIAKPARSRVAWIGIAATVALAAAALLFVLRPFETRTTVEPTPLAAAPPPGSEVVEVDFGYSTGAIFSVEGREGEHYAVVWISDENPDLDAAGEERVQ